MIGGDVLQYFDHPLWSHAASHADLDLDGPVLIRKSPVFDLVGDERSVGQNNFRTIRRADDARPDPDPLNLSDIRIDLHHIADF